MLTHCQRLTGEFIVGLSEYENNNKNIALLCLQKQKHLEQNFPVSEFAKIRLLTAIAGTTFGTEFSLL